MLRARVWPSFSPSCELCEEECYGSGFQPRRIELGQEGLFGRGVTPRRDRIIDSIE